MILKAARISAVKGYVSQKMILKAVKISSGQDPLLKQSEIIAEKITAIITEIITGIKNVVIKNVVKKKRMLIRMTFQQQTGRNGLRGAFE